jgi:predicted phage-related endonuclease
MELVEYNGKELVVAQDLINQMKEFERRKVQIEIQEKQLREELLEAFEKYGIDNWHTEDNSIRATYKKSYIRTSIDSKRLKEELPDVAEEYSKITEVKPSIELKIEV